MIIVLSSMADSEDSGVIVESDSGRLLKYEMYVVICNVCSHVIVHANKCIRREELWSIFPIDVLTVALRTSGMYWECRNCSANLSSGVPSAIVERNWRSNQCVLSHTDTTHRFAVFEIVQWLVRTKIQLIRYLWKSSRKYTLNLAPSLALNWNKNWTHIFPFQIRVFF